MVWVASMLMVGLIPSNTGAPEGKMTGYKMSHYIEPDGPFDVACRELLATGFRINWADRIIRPNPFADDQNGSSNGAAFSSDGDSDAAGQIKAKDRIKFTCPSCAQNAWAKPSSKLMCWRCKIDLSAQQ